MKIRYATTALPILAGLFLVPAARAQGGSAARSPEPAPSKVGVLNIQVAITSTADGKQASAELQSQFAPRQAEIENLSKQIDDLRNRLRAGASTLSDDEKARLAREGDQLTRTLQRKQQDFQDDSNEAQREVIDRIGRKMLEVLDRFAKENGYAVIIDTSSQNTPVVYAANQIDVTQDIIRLYDQAHPVKSAAQPAQPRSAAPKPAPTKPPSSPSKPPEQ
jgi:outer membrane protein